MSSWNSYNVNIVSICGALKSIDQTNQKIQFRKVLNLRGGSMGAEINNRSSDQIEQVMDK